MEMLTMKSEIDGEATLKCLQESCAEMGCEEYCNTQTHFHEKEGCGSCGIQKAFTKLFAYEKTGLKPAQIIEMDKLYQEKCEELAQRWTDAVKHPPKWDADTYQARARNEFLEYIRNKVEIWQDNFDKKVTTGIRDISKLRDVCKGAELNSANLRVSFAESDGKIEIKIYNSKRGSSPEHIFYAPIYGE